MSWTEIEKKVLFREILNRNYETEVDEADFEELGKCVNKTKDEVKSLLNDYKIKAEKELENNVIRLNSVSSQKLIDVNLAETEPPLNKWIWLLKQTNRSSNSFYEAVKLISEYEDHPPPGECNGIDFKLLYNTLANFFSGDVPAELDLKHQRFLKKTFTELWQFSLSSEKCDKVNFLQNVTRLFPDVGFSRNEIESNPIPGFAEFCSKKNYNPLDVPLVFLKNDVKSKKKPGEKINYVY